jgi:hypothetical protein
MHTRNNIKKEHFIPQIISIDDRLTIQNNSPQQKGGTVCVSSLSLSFIYIYIHYFFLLSNNVSLTIIIPFIFIFKTDGGVALSIRTGATGAGLNDMVDALVGNPADGLTMYRSWSSGNWLMPRILPPDIFPSVIVRREGELGLTVTSKIEVGTLFQNRDKPPKELRLTVQFRNRISAHTEFHPVVIVNDDNNSSMTVSFQVRRY